MVDLKYIISIVNNKSTARFNFKERGGGKSENFFSINYEGIKLKLK